MNAADTASRSVADRSFGRNARRLRLNTLVTVRWLAAFGQLAAILFVYLVLGFHIPLVACLVCVGFSVALNIGLRARNPVSKLLGENEAAAILGYDILQLAALLFLTGGLANPFAILLLAPVTIAASALALRRLIPLLALTLLATTVLAFWRLPLPWVGGAPLILPPYPYVIGLWTALAVSAVFVAIYAYRVAREGRQLAQALAATELALARASHLSQLDGLAAAAAHELGTPLATVALVVREMASSPPPSPGFSEDLSLLEESVRRCRAILGKLSSHSELTGGQLEITSPTELVELAAAPHRLLGVAIVVESEGAEPAPRCPRKPGVLYGLGNLVENAVSFADSEVRVRANWSKTTVSVEISDDGPGFPPQVLARVGEPYISARSSARRNEEAGGGLGLGLFIAGALLERSGAAVELANAIPPNTGAIARIVWPRDAYEQAPPGRI